MMIFASFIILTLCVSTWCVPLDYYLSPSGNDGGNGTQASPWRTIERAQNQVRTLRTQHGGTLPGPININFESGIYYIMDTITFGSGTFYYDSTKQTVTYYGNPGEDPNKATSIVPQLIELLSISGESSHPVQYVSFESLTFSHAMVDITNCLSTHCDAQSASFLTTAAVHLNNAGFVNLLNIEISHVGGYALWMESACNSILVQYGHLWDLGAGGVRIGDPRGGTAPPGVLSTHITVNDSLIEDGGHYYQMGVGVFLQQAAKNIIAHNEIRYFRYTGVSAGWSWGYDATSNSDNFIGYNLIHHIGEGYLSDMGCVYHLGVASGTQIYNNICHDVWSYNYGGWGLYTDEGSSQVTIENNIVYLTKCAGIHQHYGEDNLFINNIIAFTADRVNDEPHCYAAVRSSQWTPGSGKGDHSSFTFRRNIVYINQGALFMSTNIIGFDNMTFDYNTYWSTQTAADLEFPPTQKPTTFKQWETEGKDVHSVLSDPLFVAPSTYDFRLQSNSPALKLGFVPIDTSQVGPRKIKTY